MIKWTEQLATGNASIDSDHQQIIEALNTLEKAIIDGATEQDLLATLNFLKAYVNQHFSREEVLMKASKCAVYTLNCQEHKRLNAKLDEWDRLLAKGFSIPLLLQVYRELADWITNHILKVDCQLRCINPGG